MIYLFEIYDRKTKMWYLDYTTKDLKIAEEYFKILLKSYSNDKSIIRVITQLDI